MDGWPQSASCDLPLARRHWPPVAQRHRRHPSTTADLTTHCPRVSIHLNFNHRLFESIPPLFRISLMSRATHTARQVRDSWSRRPISGVQWPGHRLPDTSRPFDHRPFARASLLDTLVSRLAPSLIGSRFQTTKQDRSYVRDHRDHRIQTCSRPSDSSLARSMFIIVESAHDTCPNQPNYITITILWRNDGYRGVLEFYADQ